MRTIVFRPSSRSRRHSARTRPWRILAVGVVGLGLLTACGGTGATGTSGESVTVYSADGLGDWYETAFADFTEETGIAVNYVESGSGEVVSRAEKESANRQVDVLVTLPPFIQQARHRGLIEPSGIDLSAVDAADKADDGSYVGLANNYFAMIRNTGVDPVPDRWEDLLDPALAGRIQYSTPGQAGDGTAMLLLLQHVLGDREALDYLKALQANNVGPSSSTGKLGPKVAKGELAVANSDVQMALAAIDRDGTDYEVFLPAAATGERTTVALPYAMGLGTGAPHADNGRRLMEFLLSEQVQQTLPSGAYGLPVRSGVDATGPEADELRHTMEGVTVWRPDWDEVLRTLDTDLADYNSATGQ